MTRALTKFYQTAATCLFGNGGSAADAQHFSAELVGKYKKNDRRAFKVLALNTDTSFMTAWSNDFNYSSIKSLKMQQNSIFFIFDILY